MTAADPDPDTVEAVARALWQARWSEIPWEKTFAIDRNEHLKFARAAIAAYQRAPGWRPISTAPRDGTAVLAWDVDAKEPCVVVFDGCWVERYGGWRVGFHYWMPLPAPPAPDDGQQDKGDGHE